MKGLTNKVFVALSFLSVAGSVFGMGRINERLNAIRINTALVKISMLASNIYHDQIRSCISVNTKLIADAVNKKVPIVGIDSGLMGLSLLAVEIARQQISVMSANSTQQCDLMTAEIRGLELVPYAVKEVLGVQVGAAVVVGAGLGLCRLYNAQSVRDWLKKNPVRDWLFMNHWIN